MKNKIYTAKSLYKKLGKFLRVENVPSRNGCGSAPNQFVLTYEHGEVFQSYRTVVGICVDGKYYFGTYHTCSNTTSSHVKRWCGYTAKERREGIASGEFGFFKN